MAKNIIKYLDVKLYIILFHKNKENTERKIISN